MPAWFIGFNVYSALMIGNHPFLVDGGGETVFFCLIPKSFWLNPISFCFLQDSDGYYDPYDITDSSRNISGMSSPTSHHGNGSPSMSPYRLVPPISSAEKEVRVGQGWANLFIHFPYYESFCYERYIYYCSFAKSCYEYVNGYVKNTRWIKINIKVFMNKWD